MRLLAEHSNTYTPLGPSDERLENERYVIWLGPGSHPGFTVVQRLRLASDAVEATVAEVREVLAARGRAASTWEVSSSATPPDLVERLEALGMVPDHDPHVVGMVLTAEPPASPAIEARAVSTLEEYRAAQRVMEAAFGMTEAQIAEKQSLDEQAWAERDPRLSETFLAWLDGEPVAAATATYTPHGVVLNAGSTLPHARGRGAYRALVRARWDEAVRRGTPSLVTQAGAMSLPILSRLGFREVAEIRILRDEPG